MKKQNPITTNPLLKMVYSSNYRNDLRVDTYAIKRSIINFKKEFYTLSTTDKMTEAKIINFIFCAGFNFKDYLIQCFTTTRWNDFKGVSFNQSGSIISSRSNYNERELRPYNNFNNKTDFLNAAKQTQTKVFIIQKRSDLKISKYRDIPEVNYLVNRFKNDTTRSGYYYNYYFTFNSKKETFSLQKTSIDKSGYYIAAFKQKLNERLSEYKRQNRLKEFNILKDLNHLESTKKALKNLVLKGLERFLNALKNKTLEKKYIYISNGELTEALSSIEKLENAASIKVLKNTIKNIIKISNKY